jgi:hypothetical protein
LMPGIEPRASRMLRKGTTTELHPTENLFLSFFLVGLGFELGAFALAGPLPLEPYLLEFWFEQISYKWHLWNSWRNLNMGWMLENHISFC